MKAGQPRTSSLPCWQENSLLSVSKQGKWQMGTVLESDILREMIIGGVTYDILSFLQGNETSVDTEALIARCKEMGGERDRKIVLVTQDKIPTALRGKVGFVFVTEDGRVSCVYWLDGRWVYDEIPSSLRYDWSGFHRVLRRRSR